MPKKHILIVEDEWIIYDNLSTFLADKGYHVAPYTKRYEEAIVQIKSQRPAIVLLDINLQGDLDGIDLGEQLFKHYKIPFIYLSSFSDEVTVSRARRTYPETFLIKTKPQIDKVQLALSIQMVLARNHPVLSNQKDAIFAYTEYYFATRDAGSDETRKVLLNFDQINWIETDIEKRNYLIFHTDTDKAFFKSSLAGIKALLPFHFAQINQHQIVNLKKVDGKINHSSFKIKEEIFRIGPNFSDGVHQVLHCFYVE